MRDLQKDLEICKGATPGPWEVFPEVCGPEGQTVFQVESGGDICDVADPYPRGENRPTANMHFIAEARQGWPEAIRRAKDAEERVAWLEKRLAFVEDSETLLGEELAKCRKEIARLKSDAGWDFESKPDWRRQEVE